VSPLEINVDWEASIDGEEPRPAARWGGGGYVDLLSHNGEAVDVINVFDYREGKPWDLEKVEAAVRERIKEEIREMKEEEEG